MKLKMYIRGKSFGKVCVKDILDTLFQYVVCNQGRDGVRHEGK